MVDYPLHISDTYAQITHGWHPHIVKVALFIHRACTQTIKSWTKQAKVYQFKTNSNHSVYYSENHIIKARSKI